MTRTAFLEVLPEGVGKALGINYPVGVMSHMSHKSHIVSPNETFLSIRLTKETKQRIKEQWRASNLTWNEYIINLLELWNKK